VFDALTHDRPYKIAWPVERAVAEVLSQRGRQFDPAVVNAFATLDHPTLLSWVSDWKPRVKLASAPRGLAAASRVAWSATS
jgi:putative two-component system response regulator